MESRTQGLRPRPTTQKKLETKAALLKTDPLETKDKNARDQGQGPRTPRGSDLKKKVFAPKFRKFSRNLKHSSEKNLYSKNFSQALRRSSRRNKIGRDLGPFSTSQKLALSSSRGQGIFEDSQTSRPRKSSKTPPLCIIITIALSTLFLL